MKNISCGKQMKTNTNAVIGTCSLPVVVLLCPIRNSVSRLNPWSKNMCEQDFKPCKRTVNAKTNVENSNK